MIDAPPGGDRLRRIAELRRRGLPWKAVGRRVGLSANAAFMAAKRAGLTRRSRGLDHHRRDQLLRYYEAGLTDIEMAERFGVHPDTVSRWRNKMGIRPQPTAPKRGGDVRAAMATVERERRERRQASLA